MLNVPQPIRNQIAKEGMAHSTLAAIFSMPDEDQADKALLKLARRQAINEALIRPWATVAPMMLENVAINRFVAKNPDWRMTLPEILTTAEACQTAQADYLLTEKQMQQLAQSLSKPLPKSLN